jgi:hypothetical protein
MAADEGDSGDDPWRVVADQRGFTEALEGKDFFAAAQFRCIVDTNEPPQTLLGLVDESDLIALGSIVEVVALPEHPSKDHRIQEEIRLRVEIAETVKGDAGPSILVLENCGTGGKITPLRERIPAESFLFFLSGPAPRGLESQPVFHLMYYHLGIVAETDDGVHFALDAMRPSPSLAEFESLDAIMDVVSERAP